MSVSLYLCWSITGRLPDTQSKTLKLTHPPSSHVLMVLKWAERLKQKERRKMGGGGLLDNNED